MTELEGGDENWMYVRNNENKIGVVPRNYVEYYTDPENEEIPLEDYSDLEKYIVLYAYTPEPAQAETCLTIVPDQILYVEGESGGWFNAHTEDGRVGYVPAGYVQKL